MTEGDPGPGGATGPMSVGDTLREARQAQRLTLDDISARTRVPLRHLQAVEADNYAGLPSPTYAVGFARAYARAVGIPDAPVAAQVRAEVNRSGPRKPEYTPFEMADPARVPPRGLTIVALGVAIALLIVGGLWFASTRFQTDAGRDASNAVIATVPAAATTAVPAPTAEGGQVTLAATDDVWLRVYDAGDATLFVGNMKAGDRFDVPAAAREPRVDVGRPDKLAVTLNGSAVPALGTGERPVRGVPVDGGALARRMQGDGVPDAAPTPVGSLSPDAAIAASVATAPVAAAAVGGRIQTRRAVPPRATRLVPRPAPRQALTETQRANLASAAQLRTQTRRQVARRTDRRSARRRDR